MEFTKYGKPAYNGKALATFDNEALKYLRRTGRLGLKRFRAEMATRTLPKPKEKEEPSLKEIQSEMVAQQKKDFYKWCQGQERFPAPGDVAREKNPKVLMSITELEGLGKIPNPKDE